MSFAFQGGTTGGAFQYAGFAFQQEAGDVPPVVDPYPKPAGRKRRKYEVEIDGQVFPVDSIDHAQALFERARELARQQAPIVAERVVAQRITSKAPEGKPIRVPNPQIWTSDPALVPLIAKARVDIAKIYRDAALEAEIAFRLKSQMIEEDDEDILLFM